MIFMTLLASFFALSALYFAGRTRSLKNELEASYEQAEQLQTELEDALLRLNAAQDALESKNH